MGEREFTRNARALVLEYYDGWLSKEDETPISETEVYVVWLCKILQNNKALLSTTRPDGMYFEVTYNGDREEFYLDAYRKVENVLVKAAV